MHHSRPYTPMHRWYYTHSRPVYHVNVHRSVHWYHGVWVYGPRPVHHHYYGGGSSGGGTVDKSEVPDLPTRKVDRNDTFRLGVQGGTHYSAFNEGAYSFGDAGLGLNVGYRPVESVGFELTHTYFDQTFDEFTQRQTSTSQASVNVYAVPWKRVSPYLNLGATMSRRSYDGVDIESTAYGPHAGLGVELAIGERAAIDLRGQYIGYVNVGDDQQVPGALQGTGGVSFYF
ncbi:MAG TPA: outer membrane beta-barrel protein [Myxococcota bacterium]|nr:outer membrane beta-barrel protein [Myxococcota bacterium]